VENRGKLIPLADQLYVSPYLLRPLRRLEEVEGEAKRRTSGSGRQGKPANDTRGSKPDTRQGAEK
jgi:hypothetical protein